MPSSVWTDSGSSVSVTIKTITVETSTTAGSADYLTNADKVSLMSAYTSELAMKTSLDSTAADLRVSTTTYDSAVAAINTSLINAAAPSNWATTWPDGTIFGPVVGIKTMLADCWSSIATARSTLQSTISSAQAAQQAASAKNAAISAAATDASTKMNNAITQAQTAANTAQANAIAAAATDATTKTNAAVLASQPHQVTWAYAAKPALPSNSYPAGYYAITTDARTVQVNTAGTAWMDVLVATTRLFGQVVASQMTLANVDNLIPNPNSEQVPPAGGWPNGAIEAIGLDTRYPYSGSHCRLFFPTAGTSGYSTLSPNIPAAAGDQYYFEAMTACDPYEGSTRFLGMDFLAADGSYINGVYGTERFSDGWLGSGSTSWVKQSIAGQAPAGTCFVRFNFYTRAGSSHDGLCGIDNMYARRMDDGRLTIDGSLTASKANIPDFRSQIITSKVITADNMAAGAATIQSLTVANFDNLVPNPNSEQPAPSGGWPAGSIESLDLLTNTPWAYSGSNCRGFTAPPGSAYERVYTPKIPCNVGDAFYFEAYAAIDPYPGVPWWQLVIDFYNSTGSWVGGTYGSHVGPTGGWMGQGNYKKQSITSSAPNGATFVTFGIFASGGTTNSSQVCVDNMYARRMADANLLVDGCVTASKADLSLLDAAVAHITELDGDNVNIININASNITTGTLSAHKVLFDDNTSLTTASRVLTSRAAPSNYANTPANLSGAWTSIPGFGWTISASGSADVLNILGSFTVLCLSGAQYNTYFEVGISLDGADPSVSNMQRYYAAATNTSSRMTFPLVLNIVGLAAGSHTLAVWFRSDAASQWQATPAGTFAICQRIY